MVVPLPLWSISSSNAGQTSGCDVIVPLLWVFGRNTIWVIAYEREIRSIYASDTAKNAMIADIIRIGMQSEIDNEIVYIEYWIQ